MTRVAHNSGTRYKALRRAQFISPFGVGSIVDFPDESLMPASIDLWSPNIGTKVFDERLQKRLGVKYFKMAPSYEEFKTGIPFFRFPKWLFCPSCRSLRHVDNWRTRFESAVKSKEQWRIPKCDVCRAKLVPTRFVVACENGHIDDFPWVEWAHHKKDPCANPQLEIRTGGSTSGLAGITVTCKTCHEKNSMANAFDEKAHENTSGKSCSGFKPWLNESEDCDCDCVPRTLQRGASNVYFPKIVSSIVIPPYSDDLLLAVQGHDGFSLLQGQRAMFSGPEDPYLKQTCEFIAADIGKKVEDVTNIIGKLLFGEVEETANETEVMYRYSEYRAFLGDVEEGNLNSKDFHIDIRKADHYDIPGVENIVLVHRLREIRSLVAFSRLRPLERNYLPNDEEEEEKEKIAVAVPIRKNRNIDWLPAIEVKGEGIFLSFNSEKITEWASSNTEILERTKLLNNRFNDYAANLKYESRNITSKFIFLHTLAHLLIRELSFECGYSAASLREKIYCNEKNDEPDMAAILIYTASGDSEGTMGGLVRQAEPNFFNSIIKKAVMNAVWCSSDPLCIESNGQGFNSLNLGACHACTLLPETSCEEMNRFLDRAFIVGTPEKPEIGFLRQLCK